MSALVRGPFRRPDRRRTGKQDEPGTVSVTVVRRENHSNAKGNLTRTFTVQGAKVSDVAAIVERALFGENAA